MDHPFASVAPSSPAVAGLSSASKRPQAARRRARGWLLEGAARMGSYDVHRCDMRGLQSREKRP
jgi:hypothetical protein